MTDDLIIDLLESFSDENFGVTVERVEGEENSSEKAYWFRVWKKNTSKKIEPVVGNIMVGWDTEGTVQLHIINPSLTYGSWDTEKNIKTPDELRNGLELHINQFKQDLEVKEEAKKFQEYCKRYGLAVKGLAKARSHKYFQVSLKSDPNLRVNFDVAPDGKTHIEYLFLGGKFSSVKEAESTLEEYASHFGGIKLIWEYWREGKTVEKETKELLKELKRE